MKEWGFSCDSLLAAKLEKQKKSKKNSRTFSCLNVLPPLGCLHLKIDASLRWFSRIVRRAGISEVRIIDVLHRSEFDYSTALSTIKDVLWSWPRSTKVVIDTPIRPQLEHLPVPSRWPSAQCFDLKEKSERTKGVVHHHSLLPEHGVPAGSDLSHRKTRLRFEPNRSADRRRWIRD